MCTYVYANLLFPVFFFSREVPSSGEANSTGFFGSASQSSLQSLGHINILGGNRGLSIHDMAMDQSSAQYDDHKKAKLEASMGFASSPGRAAAEAAADTFTNQSEHGSATNSNWHQAHHHAQAYTNSQYPTGYFTQVQNLLPINVTFGAYPNSSSSISFVFFCLWHVSSQS